MVAALVGGDAAPAPPTQRAEDHDQQHPVGGAPEPARAGARPATGRPPGRGRRRTGTAPRRPGPPRPRPGSARARPRGARCPPGATRCAPRQSIDDCADIRRSVFAAADDRSRRSWPLSLSAVGGGRWPSSTPPPAAGLASGPGRLRRLMCASIPRGCATPSASPCGRGHGRVSGPAWHTDSPDRCVRSRMSVWNPPGRRRAGQRRPGGPDGGYGTAPRGTTHRAGWPVTAATRS